MAFLQEVATEIWIAVLCINCGVLIVESLAPNDMLSPFTGTVVTAKTIPPIWNSTSPSGTLVYTQTNSTTNATNHNPLSPIKDFVFYPLNLLYDFVLFISGGFAFGVLGIFGFPAIFVYSLQTIIGFMLARTILYYLTGR